MDGIRVQGRRGSLVSLRPVLLLVIVACLVCGTRASLAQAAAKNASSQAAGTSSTPEANSEEKKAEVSDPNDAFRHSTMVTSLGRMMGMDAERAATAFEIVNFVVLAALVGWFLVRTLPKTFRGRTGAIQKHLVDARSATEEANARLTTVESRLGRLDEEIAALKTRAEADAAAEEDRLRASIADERQRIVTAAEQEIASATAQARRQIRIFAAEMAIDQAAKKLVVTAETDRLLVQEFARRLEDKNPRGGQN